MSSDWLAHNSCARTVQSRTGLKRDLLGRGIWGNSKFTHDFGTFRKASPGTPFLHCRSPCPATLWIWPWSGISAGHRWKRIRRGPPELICPFLFTYTVLLYYSQKCLLKYSPPIIVVVSTPSILLHSFKPRYLDNHPSEVIQSERNRPKSVSCCERDHKNSPSSLEIAAIAVAAFFSGSSLKIKFEVKTAAGREIPVFPDP